MLRPIDDDIIDHAYQTFLVELNDFMESTSNNRWLYGEDVLSVYVRKGHHSIKGVIFPCFDIATIVVGEKYRGNGLGTRVINHLHRINPFRVTYVENIGNMGLYHHLLNDGWSDLPNQYGGSPCVYQFKPLKLSDKDN